MKNLRRLNLHNFQSHEDTTIEFHGGVNVIVGSSDEGKSAVIRALAAVLQNDVNVSYVRHGANCFEVTAQFDDGTSLVRIKGPKVNKYILNGEVFERLGDSVPDKVRQAIGNVSVFIDDDEIPVSISKQGTEPFLLSESAPIRAKMLGMISGIDVIDRALREMKKDQNQIQSNITFEQGSLDQQVKDLKEINDELFISSPYYEALEKSSASYERVSSRHEKLYDLRHNLGFLQVDIDAVKDKVFVLDMVLGSISFDHLLMKVDRLARLFSLQRDLTVLNDAVKIAKVTMTALDAVMSQISFDRLLTTQKKFARLLPLCEKYHLIDADINRLKAAADVLLGVDFDDVNNVLRDMKLKHERAQGLHKFNRELETLEFAITKMTVDLSESKAKLDSTRKELGSLGVCPFCMRGISDEYMETILEKM